jgi:hypothetical protein
MKKYLLLGIIALGILLVIPSCMAGPSPSLTVNAAGTYNAPASVGLSINWADPSCGSNGNGGYLICDGSGAINWNPLSVVPNTNYCWTASQPVLQLTEQDINVQNGWKVGTTDTSTASFMLLNGIAGGTHLFNPLTCDANLPAEPTSATYPALPAGLTGWQNIDSFQWIGAASGQATHVTNAPVMYEQTTDNGVDQLGTYSTVITYKIQGN